MLQNFDFNEKKQQQLKKITKQYDGLIEELFFWIKNMKRASVRQYLWMLKDDTSEIFWYPGKEKKKS